ncbi:MAG TPA: hypothetical protein VMS73_04890 [Anaerolineaceae bacterium]|nr:hypothetical protein [Anaerolineaceae bacterium]
MANNSQLPDDTERRMAQRRRNNTIMILVIGLALLIFVAFSQNPGAVVYLVGTFAVVGILLYARSIVERNYKRRAAEALKALEDKEASGSDDPKK